MRDLARLIIRLTLGSLMAGHGSQKLFGWFGGHGLEGTGAWFESGLGLRPGRRWAFVAGLSETGGGTLTALGLFHPLGPIGIMAAMAMATKAHRGKPIWVTAGGAEFPVTNFAVALGLSLVGPGRYSLDRAFGIRLPWWVVALAAAAAATGVAYGYRLEAQPPAQQPAQPAQAETSEEAGQEPAELEQARAAREARPVESAARAA